MSPIIRQDCPCPKKTCPRYTRCDECEAAHLPKGGLPYCKRPQKSLWDRIKKMLGTRK